MGLVRAHKPNVCDEPSRGNPLISESKTGILLKRLPPKRDVRDLNTFGHRERSLAQREAGTETHMPSFYWAYFIL